MNLYSTESCLEYNASEDNYAVPLITVDYARDVIRGHKYKVAKSIHIIGYILREQE